MNFNTLIEASSVTYEQDISACQQLNYKVYADEITVHNSTIKFLSSLLILEGDPILNLSDFYRHLSPEVNPTSQTLNLTSMYTFLDKVCPKCHKKTMIRAGVKQSRSSDEAFQEAFLCVTCTESTF